MTGYLRTMIAVLMFAALQVMMPGLPAAADDGWGGTWFTCEFARSQTPPLRISFSAATPAIADMGFALYVP